MDPQEPRLPYLSADLPGIGGRLRCEIEDFQVEELPAYMPSGEGDHIYAWVEKRGMTTAALTREIARALDIRDSDIGAAGMKDKFALTRQMLSLPPPTTPEAVMALEIPGARILSAKRHGNKLRTGHLRGNQFLLRVRDLDCPAEEAEKRARAILEMLGRTPGAPNWYGGQRFGRSGDNARVGKALVMRTKTPGRTPRGRQRRLYISAYQSQLFNDYLEARLRDDVYSSVLEGDVLQKRESGGMFVSEDQGEDQARFNAGELGLTGPMFGHKMKVPMAESPADLRESKLLAREEIELQSFAHLSKLAKGTRRPLAVVLDGAEAKAVDDGLDVQFTLPSGSYATAIMREIIKGKQDFPE
jgi:tRNA pseudouridine13 synthase